MGYTTDFDGEFTLDRPLSEAHRAYLSAFGQTRRMGRDADQAERLDDPLRVAVGLPIGAQGGYYVGTDGARGNFGQNGDAAVTDFNDPPEGQPSLWCQWVPNADGTAILWDDGEKFYEYERWLEYLLDHFLKPWGYVLNGEVTWAGEDPDDRGKLILENNVLRVQEAEITYRDRPTMSRLTELARAELERADNSMQPGPGARSRLSVSHERLV